MRNCSVTDVSHNATKFLCPTLEKERAAEEAWRCGNVTSVHFVIVSDF